MTYQQRHQHRLGIAMKKKLMERIFAHCIEHRDIPKWNRRMLGIAYGMGFPRLVRI